MNSKLKAPLLITEMAANQISLLMKSKNAYGIKLGIKKRGCNGYSYVLNYC